MTQTLPYESVSYQWLMIGGDVINSGINWPWDEAEKETFYHNDVARVTLANGQRIIVRALSEDRKAARAEARRARLRRVE